MNRLSSSTYWPHHGPHYAVYRPRARLHITPKLIFDVAAAGAALILLSPLLLLVALAIRLESKGPILFSQTRYGWDNRPFRIYKFRTMWTHLCDRSGVDQTREDDPRITPLGAILRRTNIDELPCGRASPGWRKSRVIAARRSIRFMRGCVSGLTWNIAAATRLHSTWRSSSRLCAVSWAAERGSDVGRSCSLGR